MLAPWWCVNERTGVIFAVFATVKSATNESSATLQPFYTLQLDIQSENIKSVDDALMENFASEQLDGYICSKTNKQVCMLTTVSEPFTFYDFCRLKPPKI